MTEKEKMLAGEVYSVIDSELLKEQGDTREKIYEYNSMRPSETTRMKSILHDLLGHVGDDEIIINQPFRCDYGKQISVGKRFFANFNLTILDEAYVTIGDDCFIGPNVSIYTACHSTDPTERNSRREWAEPVKIGNNVWIGGSVTILPGVTIGDNVTIGAGSVVVKDIPSNVVAVGNPCKVVKNMEITLPQIRSYQERDRDEVIALALHFQNDGSRDFVTIDDQPDLLHIEEEYVSAGGAFWVAEANGKVVGTIAIKPYGGGIYALKKFFVYEDFQGEPHHLGRRLYQQLLDFSHQVGARVLVLDTPKNTTRAHKFYVKAGFRQVGEDELPIKYSHPYEDYSDYFILKLGK